MTLWRISRHATLDGGGGLRAPGRWHTRGRRIVYCAPNPATALLEILVHAEIDIGDIPAKLSYLEIEAPDSLAIESVEVSALGEEWETTQPFGNEWLRAGRTPLLRVPSVIVPATWNVLMNPKHPDSKQVRIARVHEHPIDVRLTR